MNARQDSMTYGTVGLLSLPLAHLRTMSIVKVLKGKRAVSIFLLLFRYLANGPLMQHFENRHRECRALGKVADDTVERVKDVVIDGNVPGNVINDFVPRKGVWVTKESDDEALATASGECSSNSSRSGQQQMAAFEKAEKSADEIMVLATTSKWYQIYPRVDLRFPERAAHQATLPTSPPPSQRPFRREKIGQLWSSGTVTDYVTKK